VDPKYKIVAAIPLAQLWDERGTLAAERGRTLGREDIRRLVQTRTLRFVIADPGLPLRWVPPAENYVFWKEDARPHLVEEPDRPFDLSDFPRGYAYIATEWRGVDPAAPPTVLLERHH
jgi:hypothetical protein